MDLTVRLRKKEQSSSGDKNDLQHFFPIPYSVSQYFVANLDITSLGLVSCLNKTG